MKLVVTTEASGLVIRVMSDFIVHDYLEEGRWAFLKCMQSNKALRSSGMDHFVLIAEMDEKIVGTIEMRESNHIALFCVERKYRRRGIGRKLLERALDLCEKYNPELAQVSVNSLPGSVHIYEKLGFRVEKGGISCTHMSLMLSKTKNFQAIFSDEYELNTIPGWFLSRTEEAPTYIAYDG
jgi:GNAT superfamily N-acetyltransferase